MLQRMDDRVGRLSSKMVGLYATSVVASICIFLLIRSVGGSVARVDSIEAARPILQKSADSYGVLIHVLLAIIVVIVVARALGILFRRLKQPAVVGEVIAGILLGPSFLGIIAPSLYSRLLPANIGPHLGVISQIGVILYMFLVGLELDGDLLRQRTQASVAISHASIVVPFLLGSALALLLAPLFPGQRSFTAFALLVGVSTSVTAFPVLARILKDRGLQTSALGVLALACAAVDDVTAWCLLALVVGVVHARPDGVLVVLAFTICFVLFMLLVARRGALWLVRRRVITGQTTPDMAALVWVTLLVAALVTEWIGIHALFGAFLFGSIIPHDSLLAREMRERSEDLVVVLLLPVFFAFTGMRTDIGQLRDPRDWFFCALIIAVASAGKFGGSYFAARWTGCGWRDAACIGILLNTRGLMELIVLSIGLDLGVLSPKLFTMFVIMAVVTTLATTPVLEMFTKSRGISEM